MPPTARKTAASKTTAGKTTRTRDTERRSPREIVEDTLGAEEIESDDPWAPGVQSEREPRRRSVAKKAAPAARRRVERDEPEIIDVDPELVSDTYTIQGNVGGDPELRFTPTGSAVVNFSVAVDIREQDERGNWHSRGTMWVRVSAWNGLAENLAECLNKGDRVVCAGTFKDRTYVDNNTDKEVTVTEFTARDVGISCLWREAYSKPRPARTRRRDDDEPPF